MNKKGISLIVLIITIIVIIILAGAVILSLANNNPIDEANKARIESDKDNIQSAINLFLGKKIATAQANVTITGGTLNGATPSAKFAVGASAAEAFVFAAGEGTVGIALPTYEGTWSIDTNGIVSYAAPTAP